MHPSIATQMQAEKQCQQVQATVAGLPPGVFACREVKRLTSKGRVVSRVLALVQSYLTLNTTDGSVKRVIRYKDLSSAELHCAKGTTWMRLSMRNGERDLVFAQKSVLERGREGCTDTNAMDLLQIVGNLRGKQVRHSPAPAGSQFKASGFNLRDVRKAHY